MLGDSRPRYVPVARTERERQRQKHGKNSEPNIRGNWQQHSFGVVMVHGIHPVASRKTPAFRCTGSAQCRLGVERQRQASGPESLVCSAIHGSADVFPTLMYYLPAFSTCRSRSPPISGPQNALSRFSHKWAHEAVQKTPVDFPRRSA